MPNSNTVRVGELPCWGGWGGVDANLSAEGGVKLSIFWCGLVPCIPCCVHCMLTASGWSRCQLRFADHWRGMFVLERMATLHFSVSRYVCADSKLDC